MDYDKKSISLSLIDKFNQFVIKLYYEFKCKRIPR
jgi:hypothetical protein